MTLDTRAIALAGSVTGALVFGVCAALVAVAPGTIAAFFSYVLHIDRTGLARAVTWRSYSGGLVCITLGTAVVLGFVGWLHNVLVRRWHGTTWLRAAEQRG